MQDNSENCVHIQSCMLVCRHGASVEQTMKLLEGQLLFVNNALPYMSIFQAKCGATDDNLSFNDYYHGNSAS